MLKFKLGKKARSYSARIPHYSALMMAGRPLAPIPDAHDWTVGMPEDLGVMLNDELGDCTCAGFYHGQQVWDFNAQPPLEKYVDGDVLQMYEEACGYRSGHAATDQGGDEQAVMRYLLTTGAPDNGGPRNRILGYAEVDPKKIGNVKRCIFECGFAYIGFQVPAYLPEDPGAVWDLQPHSDNTIQGGHCVILAGYDAEGATVISWGSKYRMTWAFFDRFVDEAYGLWDALWIAASGMTPAGLSVEELEEQMVAIRESVGRH